MWVIVHFLEESKVEAVPKIWVKDDTCWWPSTSPERLRRLIEKRVSPEASNCLGTMYKVRLLGHPYDDLKKAREKSKVATHTSDIELSGTERKKRKIVPSKRYELTDSDSPIEEEMLSSEEEDIPAFPPTPIRKSPRKHTAFSTLQSPVRSEKKTPGAVVKRKLNMIIGSCQLSKEQSPESAPSTSKDTQGNSMKKKSSDGFEAKVLRKLNTIIAEIRQLKGNKIVDNPKGQENMEEDEFEILLPVASILDLQQLEDVLAQSQDKIAKLAVILGRAGGTRLPECVRRVLKASMTDSVAAEYSWAGKKGKKVFCDLKLKLAVFKAARTSFPLATDSEIEAVVKEWLRPAKYRALKGKPSEARAIDAGDGNNEDGNNDRTMNN